MVPMDRKVNSSDSFIHSAMLGCKYRASADSSAGSIGPRPWPVAVAFYNPSSHCSAVHFTVLISAECSSET